MSFFALWNQQNLWFGRESIINTQHVLNRITHTYNIQAIYWEFIPITLLHSLQVNFIPLGIQHYGMGLNCKLRKLTLTGVPISCDILIHIFQWCYKESKLYMTGWDQIMCSVKCFSIFWENAIENKSVGSPTLRAVPYAPL